MSNYTNPAKLIYPRYFPMLIIALLTALLSACVLSPIYTQIISDVTLMYTVLPIVIDYVIIAFDIIYIALLFAIISYSSYSHLKGEESKYTGLLLTFSVIVLKHILNLTVSSIIDNYIDITFDIPVTLTLIAVDSVTILIVRGIATRKSSKHLNHAKRMQKASKYLDNVVYDEQSDIFPFHSLLNIKNPIIFPIFVGIIISVSILIIQRLYADFVVIGLPSSLIEVVEMVIAYISDILIGIIGYVAAYFSASYPFTNTER